MLNKLTCNFCYKTIRKDFTPITCTKYSALFHKKCAKKLITKHWLLTFFIVVV